MGQDPQSFKDSNPLYGFIENNGQIVDQANQTNPSVRYLLALSNNTVSLKKNGFSYDTYVVEQDVNREDVSKRKPEEFKKKITRQYHRVDVEFVGANPDPKIFASGEASDYINYVTSSGSPIKARHFKKITYANIYPGIDVEFLSAAGETKPVEYNFIVRPGADVNQIQLRYTGANSSRLKDGKLELDLDHGKLSESIPASYWRESKKKENIEYRKIKSNKDQITIGFQGSIKKERSEVLIIDPTPNLEWEQIFSSGWILGVYADRSNNPYAFGRAFYPAMVSEGEYHTTVVGASGFVAKFEPDGTKVWSTYYGGDDTYVSSIAVDVFGNLCITGWTNSTIGISTFGAYQFEFGGTNDAFVAKFNSNGSFVWGSYYGGIQNEQGAKIIVDNSQQIYMTLQDENWGLHLLKWNELGRLKWSVLLGGSYSHGFTARGSLSIDSEQNILVSNHNQPEEEVTYFKKYSSTGALVSQFSISDLLTDFVCDNNGYIYGITSDNASIVKYSGSGVFQWETNVLINSGGSDVSDLALNSEGKIFVTGYTHETHGIPTEGAYEFEYDVTTYSLSRKPFITALNNSGSIEWWTYYSPSKESPYFSSVDVIDGRGIAVDENNAIYVCGDGFIGKGYISKFYVPEKCPFSSSLTIQNTQYLCAQKFNVPQIQSCNASYNWDFGDGATSQEQSPLHVYSSTGNYNVTLALSYNCGSCEGDTTLTKTVIHNPSQAAFEDELIEIPTDSKEDVLSVSVSTFSDSWSLPHYQENLNTQNTYLNGSQGVWRNNSSYTYQTPRLASPSVDISKGGTFNVEMFNWDYAALEAIPNWVRVNTMTSYSPFSYELENKDVLGIYSAALYDYGGHLPSANGVNMRNSEMAFTSFENLDNTISGDFFDNTVTGNLLFGNSERPEYKSYGIQSGRDHIAVVKASLEELTDVTGVDVIATGHKFLGATIPLKNTYSYDNEIICKVAHPETPEWSIIVLRENVYNGIWNGQLRITNSTPERAIPVIDTLYHSGRNSLKISQASSFDQPLLSLDSGKVYHLNAWVSINNPSVLTPVLADELGIEVSLRDKDNNLISLDMIVPIGAIIEGWQQVRGTFICPDKKLTLSLKFKPGSAGTAWYDDLRIHPANGNMQSYVYTLNDYRLQSILDAENFGTFFYYDSEGNLYLTKKETEGGIKTLSENISYQIEQN